MPHWPRFRSGSRNIPLPGKKDKKAELAMRRTSSEQVVVRVEQDTIEEDMLELPPQRSRANTFTNGVSRPSLPTGRASSNLNQIDDMHMMEQYTQLASPRHFQRRRAVVEDELKGDIGLSLYRQASLEKDAMLVRLEEEGNKMEDSAQTKNSHSLRDIVEMLFIKNNVFPKYENLDDYNISATFQDTTDDNVNLDLPSVQFTGHTIEIKPKESISKDQPQELKQCFSNVQDCLSYFSAHGLVELPLSHDTDEDSFRLPRVQPIDSIVSSWFELPIDPQVKEALTKKEFEQQLAVWEFIYTEHSHIRHLETIINVFMRCLELIRRAKLLTDESYHNVFGYMEDIYHAHDQFWTWTLEPVLETVYETGLPLDLSDIIQRFPEFGAHFEIYEQHCQLEALNLHSLKKAKENSEFTAYLKWCEAQPECHRLQLDQFLATPMQRLTRYPLLTTAIIKKTTQPHLKQRLEHLCGEMHEFVQCVNSGIRIQQETERVRDAMNRITGFHVVDIPSELKDLVQPYTHLDLLAPMPGVEVDRSRVLMLEGTLKYRDNAMSKMAPLHLFLFTDMLLITKLSGRKGGDNYTIIREPYKIDRLVLQQLEPGMFCGVVLNEFHVTTTWFILKANSPVVADQWMEQINTAQHFYTEAVERRAQNWKLLQSLQSERILNGIEGIESLSCSLSQSLWSINGLRDIKGRNRSFAASTDCLSLKRESSPAGEFGSKIHSPITRTHSAADPNEEKALTLPRHHKSTSVDLTRQLFGMKGRTASVDLLFERPQRKTKSTSSLSTSQQVSKKQSGRLSESAEDVDSMFSTLQQIPVSPLSDDSGTESGGTAVDEISQCPSLSSENGRSLSFDSNGDHPSESSCSTKQVPNNTTPPMPLKSILRSSKQSHMDDCNSYGTQLDTPRINRASSDDSGIAMKPMVQSSDGISPSLLEMSNQKHVSLSTSLPCSPSAGRASIPNNSSPVRPKKHVRLQVRSNSETTLQFSKTILAEQKLLTIPAVDESRENLVMVSKNSSEIIPLGEPDTSTTKKEESEITDTDTKINSSASENSFIQVEVTTQLEKNAAEISKPRKITPLVKKKPLCHQLRQKDTTKTINSTLPSSPTLERETEPSPQQKAEKVRDIECSDQSPNPVRIQNPSPLSPSSRKQKDTSELGKKNKPSRLRTPSASVSVKELRQVFDSSDKDLKTSKIPISKAAKRKISEPQTQAPSKVSAEVNLNRSRSISRTNNPNTTPFRRQYAKRYSDSSSHKEDSVAMRKKLKEPNRPSTQNGSTITPQAPNKKVTSPSRSRQDSVSPRRKSSISVSTVPKPKSEKQKTPTLNSHRNLKTKTSRRSASPILDQDTLSKLAALTPQFQARTNSARSQPGNSRACSVGCTPTQDLAVPIVISSSLPCTSEQFDSSENTDSILLALNLNSNNNNNTSSQSSCVRKRQSLETLKQDFARSYQYHKDKLSPVEWKNFGCSWKRPDSPGTLSSALQHSRKFCFPSRS